MSIRDHTFAQIKPNTSSDSQHSFSLSAEKGSTQPESPRVGSIPFKSHRIMPQTLAVATMTMVMAPPAMPVMRVTNIDNYLRTRCGNQRHQERKGENSKRNLLHTHGCYLSYQKATQFKSPRIGSVHHSLQQAKRQLAAMTMMMAVPAMTMMLVSYLNDNLGARCRYQRNEEHKGEKTKHKFLHSSFGCPTTGPGCGPISSNYRACTKQHIENSIPTDNPLGFQRRCAPLHTLGSYNQPRRWPIKF
jgi:hypothetical protein